MPDPEPGVRSFETTGINIERTSTVPVLQKETRAQNGAACRPAEGEARARRGSAASRYRGAGE